MIDEQSIEFKNRLHQYISSKNNSKNLRGITKYYTFASL